MKTVVPYHSKPWSVPYYSMRNVRVLTVGFLAILAFLPTLAIADISEATFTPQGSDTYTELKPSDVVVYEYKPDFKFKIIGTIEARGMAQASSSLLDRLDILGRLLETPPAALTEKDDIALAMKALKEEAALAGAEGVLILRSTQVRVSQTATERRIIAAAIRRVKDNR